LEKVKVQKWHGACRQESQFYVPKAMACRHNFTNKNIYLKEKQNICYVSSFHLSLGKSVPVMSSSCKNEK
jgi:hypothetical protein